MASVRTLTAIRVQKIDKVSHFSRNTLRNDLCGAAGVRLAPRCVIDRFVPAVSFSLLRWLPVCFDLANAVVEPSILRDEDTVLLGKANDGPSEFLDLGSAVRDTVLRHRGHACRVNRGDEVYHVAQILLGELDSFRPCDGHGLAHSGDEAAILFARRAVP